MPVSGCAINRPTGATVTSTWSAETEGGVDINTSGRTTGGDRATGGNSGEDNAAALDGATVAAVPVATLAILGAEDDDVNATGCFELEKAAATGVLARLATYADDGEDKLGKA